MSQQLWFWLLDFEREDGVPPETLALIKKDRDDSEIRSAVETEKKRIKAQNLARAEAEQEGLGREIVAIKGSAITVRRTLWLWRDRIPVGGLALVAGKGDVSKSTLFSQFVAWITTGEMKGEYYGIPRDVGYVVNEDSISETVAPRMIAHGADMNRVHFLRVRSPLGEDALMLPRDADILRSFITDNGLVATFVDPLSANVSGRKNDQGDMRSTYQHVNRIAEDTRSAIVGLAHTRKAGAGDVMEAIMGSSEQGNVARSVHGLVMDPEEDDARILSCEKLNVGQKSRLASLRFTVDTVMVDCTDGTGDQTPMPKIRWLEEIADSASDILGDAAFGVDGTSVQECSQWLNNYLLQQGGEAFSTDVREAAGKKYSESTLKRARRRLGVRALRTREVPSRTIWVHPANAQQSIL